MSGNSSSTDCLDAKYQYLFDTSHIRLNVKAKSVKASIYNTVAQGASFSLMVVRAAVMARLLSPEDYGVIGMVQVVVSFALIFKDLGLSTATIRAKEINHAQTSNLFWINTLIGITSMAIVIGIAPVLVWFYHDERLFRISIVLSISFLFGGLSVQHQALLKRQMLFGKIGVITLCSAIASSLIGGILAWYEFKYWALVWSEISLSIFLCIGFWLATNWRPRLPSRNVGTSKLFGMGLDIAGLNAFSTLAINLDKIIVGRIANAATLGLYTKGYQVPDMVVGQVRMSLFSIALPALASLQGDIERFGRYYYKFVSFIGWITMPLAMFCFLFADQIILLYFGVKWIDSIFFMKIFSLKVFLMPALTTLDQVPLALGFSRRYLFSGVLRSLVSVLFITTGAITYGVKGAAIGLSIVDVVVFFPFFSICTRNSGVNIAGYLKAVCIPATTTILVGICFYFSRSTACQLYKTIMLLHMVLYFGVVVLMFLACDWCKLGGTTGTSRAIIDYLGLTIFGKDK